MSDTKLYILYLERQEWEEFDGTLEQLIDLLEARVYDYDNYGRQGAIVVSGKPVYTIGTPDEGQRLGDEA